MMSEDLARQLSQYVSERFAQEDEVLQYVRRQTAAHGLPLINLEANEARLIQLLVRLSGAERAVEVGTLAGYSGIWIARALPDHGKLVTIEVSSVHADLARAHFERAGLAHKVTVLQGAGVQMLPQLEAEAPWDLMFIDADKFNYSNYLAWAAENLRVGGAVLADNAFWQGRILDPQSEDDHGLADFNRMLAEHPRFEGTIIEVGDGIALGIKTG